MSVVRGTVYTDNLIWDVNTMSYVPWDGSLTAGDLTIGTVDQGAAGADPWLVTTSTHTLALDYDVDSNPIYIGLAVQGSAKSSSVWQIRKLTFDVSGNVTDLQYANGSTAFNAVWNNRASLSYS